MKKNTSLALLGATLLMSALLLSGCKDIAKRSQRSEGETSSTQSFTTLQDHQKTNILIGNKPLVVEVVNTPASMEQGLSDRSEIGADGMLFIMGKSEVQRFWMKDMHFDLDLVWINQNKILEVTANVPKPVNGTPLSKLPVYSSRQPVDMVLEIPAGDAEKMGIKTGDILSISK